MNTTNPTTMRFTSQDLVTLDAVVDRLANDRHERVSRASAVRYALAELAISLGVNGVNDRLNDRAKDGTEKRKPKKIGKGA